MAEKKVNSRTISPVASVKEGEETVEETEELQQALRPKKACLFCQSKTNPSYTDMNVLRRFVTDRAKIVLRAKSNLCSKHQRAVTKQIKYARHLALLPFVPKVF